MTNIQNILIDYSLFNKYEKSFFIDNLIVPIKEDELSLQVAVCKNSKLLMIQEKFSSLIKYKEFEEDELRFILSNLERKIELYEISLKIVQKQSFEDKKVELFFSKLLEYAVYLRTSDIHIEEFESKILFRFRIDGRFKTFFVFDKTLFRFLSSYIKLISNLDITQTRLPMDSRFSFDIKDKKYDFRVSTMPTLENESIVIRILDKTNVKKSLNSLGFSKEHFSTIQQILKLTQGLVLIAGPTGSGKTTTLYSMINELKSDEKKIITIEDPVEYKISNISQVSINNKIGLSFDLVLKNILRQDPDIIFIGEIRDKHSLDIALQASLTGHLVFASIHANNTTQTISRLIDLQADPFLISSTLKFVIAQRLVLSYCKYCSAKGCEKCNFTKYYDRSCIAEILKVDEQISSMIFKKANIQDISNYLLKNDFKTLLDDGKKKVDEKITSSQELYKVI